MTTPLSPTQRRWLRRLADGPQPFAMPRVTAQALIQRGYARADTVFPRKVRINAKGIAWIAEDNNTEPRASEA